MLSFHLKGQAAINLKVIPDDGAMLRDIYPYIRAGWHMNKQHWVTVYEDKNLDESLVQDLIRNSYELVVSKLNKWQRLKLNLVK